MRRRLALLVLATTSAVVLAFVIPLCLLVRSMAEERAMANASHEARNVAILVSGLFDDPRLGELVDAVDERSPARTSVITSDGRVLGAEAPPGLTEEPDVLRALEGAAFTEIDDRGGRILVPIVTGNGTDVVRTTVSTEELHRGVTRAWLGIIFLGLVLLVLAVVVADRFGRRLSRPVTGLATVAHRLRGGDFGARAVPSGTAETRELGEALNGLADRITELLAAERAAVGDLSHRLRTPVTALRLDVEGVHDPVVAERLQEHVEHLQLAIDAIVRAARRPVRSTMHHTCDATATVRERADFWSPLAEDQGRRFECRLPDEPVEVSVEAADLRDIVDILVDNVFAHTPESTPFSVSLTQGPRPLLTVRDHGPGMAGDAGSAAHDPQRQGFSGLGLQIVRRTVAGFDGEMTTTSVPGDGTRIQVWLPPAPPGENGSPHRRGIGRSRRGTAERRGRSY